MLASSIESASSQFWFADGTICFKTHLSAVEHNPSWAGFTALTSAQPPSSCLICKKDGQLDPMDSWESQASSARRARFPPTKGIHPAPHKTLNPRWKQAGRAILELANPNTLLLPGERLSWGSVSWDQHRHALYVFLSMIFLSC